jgi:hypothetical protein
MNGNYEWNKHLTQQRLQGRYGEAKFSRQLRQSKERRRINSTFLAAVAALWPKLSELSWANPFRQLRQKTQ